MTLYTMMRESGRCTVYKETMGYHEILSEIYVEYMSSGSVWDRPNRLFRDGDIIIRNELAEIAWGFGQKREELHKELKKQLHEHFKEPHT